MPYRSALRCWSRGSDEHQDGEDEGVVGAEQPFEQHEQPDGQEVGRDEIHDASPAPGHPDGMSGTGADLQYAASFRPAPTVRTPAAPMAAAG